LVVFLHVVSVDGNPYGSVSRLHWHGCAPRKEIDMDMAVVRSCLAIALCAVACAAPADEPAAAEASAVVTGASSVTAIASEDVTVRLAHPDENFGTLPLSVISGGAARESYLEFTVSGLPANATVTSAQLQLFVEPGGGTSDGPAVYRTPTTAWSETAMTWNTRPGTTGSALADLGAVIENTTVSLDVTPAVTGNGTYSFTLTGGSASETFIADSKENTNKPALVSATPRAAARPGSTAR
jgi:hypothetical protein